MIISKITDGLGNQMFQYALGRCLAEKTGSQHRVDLSWYENQDRHGGTNRTFTLSNFNVSTAEASDRDYANIRAIGSLAHSYRKRFVRYHLPELIMRRPRLYLLFVYFDFYKEISAFPEYVHPKLPYKRRFHEGILNISGDAYLDGYWTCPNYFTDVEEIIRREFTVPGPPEGKDRDVYQAIEESDAVGVHVRRGDVSERGEDLPLGYYRTAVKHLPGPESEYQFFVFSDDPEWVQKNLRLPGTTTFVTHNDSSTDYQDIRLLKTCDHNIIANSTFSWWGGWLNPNPNKMVLYPDPWRKKPSVERSMNEWDFIPEDWISVDY